MKPPEPDPNKAIDGLKRYLDEREKEDREFWHLMQKITDDVLMLSFSAGAGLNRKNNIDSMRLDLRSTGNWNGSPSTWDGSNKGMAIGVGQKITRTWTEVYDAVAAIAINRCRQAMVDEKAKRNARPREDVPAVGTESTWRTGPAPGPGRYLCRVDMGGSVHECTCEYRDGGRWMAYGRTLDSSFKVLGWWPLPKK